MDNGGGSAIGAIITLIIQLGILFLYIGGMWKAFAKANEPGWAAIVPIYNIITLLKIAGKPIWWIVLFLIPVVNFVAIILVSMSLAKSFGRGAGFGLGLAFLSPIFYPILGFGSARYEGPAG